MDAIEEKITKTGTRTMVALSNDPAPWVAGNYTYINDILTKLGAVNAFGNLNGWTNITPESIVQQNPELIIIIDSYKYTKDGYSNMLSIMSPDWKSTDAYKNGNIYLYCEDFGDLGSRPGPRFVQLMEIMGETIESDPNLPKAVGSEYRNYLDITKRMGD